MFGGFFNRYYYGNTHKPDFKKEDLPSNRIKLFFDVLGIRFWKLIQINLLYFLFLLPAVAWTFINLLIIQSQKNAVSSYLFFYLLVLIPCLVIAGPATAGLTFVLRNWARDEHAWIWSDFKENALKNWKESMLIMLFNGIAILVLYVNITFYAAKIQENFIYFIFRNIVIMIGIVFGMMNIYVFPMLVTYKLALRQIIKNSFIFTIVRLPYTFLFFVIACIPLFFGLINPVIIMIFYLIIGFSFIGLILTSYANATFDKYINTKIDEIEVNKGLKK